MEFEVTACAAFDVITLGGPAHLLHCRLKSPAKLGQGRLRDLSDCQDFQLDPDVVNLLDILHAKVGYPATLHGSAAHEAFILQNVKAFTDSGLSDSHFSGQLALYNSFACFELPGEYSLAQ
jgi:hypothetical protein